MVKKNRFVVLLGSVALLMIAGCTPKPASVEVQPGQGRLGAAGETLALQATVRDAAGKDLAGQAIEWSSSNPEVATVSDGIVTAVKSGTATIAAKAGAASGQAEIVVAIASAIEVMPTELSVAVGAVSPVTVTVRNEDSQPIEGAALVYETSDPAVASVDGMGQVTGVAAGTATVTVKAGAASAAVAVTVTAQ